MCEKCFKLNGLTQFLIYVEGIEGYTACHILSVRFMSRITSVTGMSFQGFKSSVKVKALTDMRTPKSFRTRP